MGLRSRRTDDHSRHHVQGVPQRQSVLQRGLRRLVPRQTSALAERDGPAMVRATWLATALCGIPALGVCGVWSLPDKSCLRCCSARRPSCRPDDPHHHHAAVGNLAQMVSHSVLVLTGFFKDIARISLGLVVALTGGAAVALWTHSDIVQFLNIYTAIYTCGALAAVGLMIRGPIRLAHEVAGASAVALAISLERSYGVRLRLGGRRHPSDGRHRGQIGCGLADESLERRAGEPSHAVVRIMIGISLVVIAVVRQRLQQPVLVEPISHCIAPRCRQNLGLVRS